MIAAASRAGYGWDINRGRTAAGMTALKKYQRLESSGLWRAAPQDRRREVVVAFGEASLVISDSRSGTALAHWSLPAVQRIGAQGALPALYAPGREAYETLEIDDETMIEAIETVRRVIASRRRSAGRARRLFPLAIALAAILAGALWLPGALIRHTASVLPAVKRAEIGADLLADITAVFGRPCAGRLGQRALDRLTARVLGPGGGRVVILRAGPDPATHLPGGYVLLSRALIEAADGPEPAAGYILAERIAASVNDPMLPLLRHAGLAASFRLLTTGDLPEGALAGYAARLVTRGAARPNPADLLARMEKAGVPATPYAFVRDASGKTTGRLIEADPFQDNSPPILLTDGDWVSLQGICEG